LGPQA